MNYKNLWFKTARRCLLGMAVFCLAGLFVTRSNAATIHVFLMGGQSNADGRADSSELLPELRSQLDVLFYANSVDYKLTYLRPWTSPNGQGIYQFGPEMTFGRTMADFYAAKGDRVAILKLGIGGGSDLYEQWKADGTLDAEKDGKGYRDFQAMVRKGLAEIKARFPGDTVEIDGMVWMQGESDAGTKRNEETKGAWSLEYAANLTALIGDIRLNFGENLPFVIGKLSQNQKGTGLEIYRENVRSAQESVAKDVPKTGLVPTDDLPLKSDQLHFDASGQQTLGKRFAEKMLKLMEGS